MWHFAQAVSRTRGGGQDSEAPALPDPDRRSGPRRGTERGQTPQTVITLELLAVQALGTQYQPAETMTDALFPRHRRA